jgi:hypothetical protein
MNVNVKLFPAKVEEIITWKQPDELRADLSFWSSFSTCTASCDEDGRKKLILIIGIEPKGGEDSTEPKVASLTVYSCGGSLPLMDISCTLLGRSVPAVAEGAAMLQPAGVLENTINI